MSIQVFLACVHLALFLASSLDPSPFNAHRQPALVLLSWRIKRSLSVGLSVLVTPWNVRKTTEPIEMPFGGQTWAPCTRWGYTWAPPVEYDWTVRARRRCWLSLLLLYTQDPCTISSMGLPIVNWHLSLATDQQII